jgi:hypothetical protein
MFAAASLKNKGKSYLSKAYAGSSIPTSPRGANGDKKASSKVEIKTSGSATMLQSPLQHSLPDIMKAAKKNLSRTSSGGSSSSLRSQGGICGGPFRAVGKAGVPSQSDLNVSRRLSGDGSVNIGKQLIKGKNKASCSNMTSTYHKQFVCICVSFDHLNVFKRVLLRFCYLTHIDSVPS